MLDYLYMSKKEIPPGGWPEPESEKTFSVGPELLNMKDRALKTGQNWVIKKSQLEASLDQAKKSGDEAKARDLKERIAKVEERIAEAVAIANASEQTAIRDQKNKKFLEGIIEKFKEGKGEK